MIKECFLVMVGIILGIFCKMVGNLFIFFLLDDWSIVLLFMCLFLGEVVFVKLDGYILR